MISENGEDGCCHQNNIFSDGFDDTPIERNHAGDTSVIVRTGRSRARKKAGEAILIKMVYIIYFILQ
jgi:hypothetical protein